MLKIKSLGIYFEGDSLQLALAARGLNQLELLDFLTIDQVFQTRRRNQS